MNNIQYKNPIKIISHDGYWGDKHTIKGIKKAQELGVWGIEEDIFERNGVIYLGEQDNGSNPTLQDALEIVDRTFIIDNTEGKIDVDLIQSVVKDKENIFILTANKDDLIKIKGQCAWNTFEIQREDVDFYHITPKIRYYVLNPAWNINKDIIKSVNDTGAKLIPVCLSYNSPLTDRLLYPKVILMGHEYIMVDYIEDFIKYCNENDIPIWKT